MTDETMNRADLGWTTQTDPIGAGIQPQRHHQERRHQESRDPVRRAFLETVAEQVPPMNAGSDVLHLTPVAGSGEPPSAYDGVLRDVEHFERAPDRTVFVSTAPVRFRLTFDADYLRSTDPRLQFRVVRMYTPLVHPNVSGSLVCLGDGFLPGTGLRGLVQQVYGIVAGRVRATHHALDVDGQRFFLDHVEEVSRLRARPLWRRALARETRIDPGTTGAAIAATAGTREG